MLAEKLDIYTTFYKISFENYFPIIYYLPLFRLNLMLLYSCIMSIVLNGLCLTIITEIPWLVQRINICTTRVYHNCINKLTENFMNSA